MDFLSIINNFENIFSNIFFMIGLILGIGLKYFILNFNFLMNDKKEILKRFIYYPLGIAIFSAIYAFREGEYIVNFFLAFLLLIIIGISGQFLFEKFRKEIFPQINILNFFIPTSYILIIFSNENLILLLISLLVFIGMIFISEKLPVFIENILYPIYLIFFIFSVVVLNLNFFEISSSFFQNYFSNGIVDLVVGGLFGYLFLITILYIYFLTSYFPGKHESNYSSRISERFKFIGEEFTNKLNVRNSVVFLVLITLILGLNLYLDLFSIEYLLLIFLSFENIIFNFTDNNKESIKGLKN